MIRIVDKKKCCGCTACMAVCPVDAITMIPDEMGFRYPSVNTDICIDCGECDSVCSFKPVITRSEEAIWSVVRYEDSLDRSQSGGFAYEAMARCIKAGFVVYGAALDDSMRTVHMRAETLEDIERFRGSKYTQSDLGGVFREIRDDLASGRKVLFTGTPCQCAGLASYVGDLSKDRLVMLDIVCHGVAAPSVWNAYVKTMEDWAGERVKSAVFRDPRFGWNYNKETFRFDGWEMQFDSFRSLYKKILMTMPSCSECPFASLARPSDMTAGDAWGIENTDHGLNDGKAVSLCILSTSAGKDLFPEIQPVDDPSPYYQGSFMTPVVPNPRSEEFRRDFIEKDYIYLDKKYVPRSSYRLFKARVHLLLRKYLHI